MREKHSIRKCFAEYRCVPVVAAKGANSKAHAKPMDESHCVTKTALPEARTKSTEFASIAHTTPGSMNSLFSDLFKEVWRDILGVVRDYSGEVLGGF